MTETTVKPAEVSVASKEIRPPPPFRSDEVPQRMTMMRLGTASDQPDQNPGIE